MVIELGIEEAERYKSLYIQYQLAMAGGYMSREEATHALREFTDYTVFLLKEHEVSPEEDWDIDVHTGTIRFE